MNSKDVENRADLEDIVERFYVAMLDDPIIGYIFTDVAKIDLQAHLPIIVDFWSDIVLKSSKNKPSSSGASKLYTGNALAKHVELNQKISLKPGHFTRWLYLFEQAIDQHHQGENVELMRQRAELVAKSISAAVTENKKSEMNLVLPKRHDQLIDTSSKSSVKD